MNIYGLTSNNYWQETFSNNIDPALCNTISQNNIVNDILFLDADFFTPKQQKEAREILCNSISGIMAELNKDENKNLTIPEKIKIAFRILKNAGFTFSEEPGDGIKHYLENNPGINTPYAALSQSLTGNLLIKNIDCDTSSYIILALADELKKKDQRWEKVEFIVIPGHAFLRYDRTVNLDYAGNYSDDFYMRKLDFDNKACFEPLKRHQIKAIGYFIKGNINYRMNNFSKALADFDKAIEINPNHEGSYTWRAACKGMMNDHIGSINDLTKANEVSSGNCRTFFSQTAQIKQKISLYDDAKI